MNIDVRKIEEKITSKTKAIMLVHVMGNSCSMTSILDLAKKYNLRMIEDTCESLGASYKNQKLGTLGHYGTYSFYYSHHMTTVEGGMVVCHSKDNYDLLRAIRSHGWIRHMDKGDQHQYELEYPKVDPRYMFIMPGYNLRPMEIQGVMGKIQLQSLDEKIHHRNSNFNSICWALQNDDRNHPPLFHLPKEEEGSTPSWFGLCLFLDEKHSNAYPSFLQYLEKNGVENRPIITGNFLRQPYFQKKENYLEDPSVFHESDYLHFHGVYIGLTCSRIIDEKGIQNLLYILFGFFIE
jgi:CDP-6-deoxy-D-xylo-4-hexulose-3-dehydrase